MVSKSRHRGTHTLTFSLDIFIPDARTRLCWSSYRADTSLCCPRGTGRGGVWCGAWPGPWTPPVTTPATCSGPTSRPSRWVKLRIRAQIDYSDSDLGRRIVFVRPNLKSLPGKIQPQERSQNFTSAAVPLESSSKTSLHVSCFLLLFLRTANAYLYLLHTWISCLLLVMSGAWKGLRRRTGQIFLQSQYSKYFLLRPQQKVSISQTDSWGRVGQTEIGRQCQPMLVVLLLLIS